MKKRRFAIYDKHALRHDLDAMDPRRGIREDRDAGGPLSALLRESVRVPGGAPRLFSRARVVVRNARLWVSAPILCPSHARLLMDGTVVTMADECPYAIAAINVRDVFVKGAHILGPKAPPP